MNHIRIQEGMFYEFLPTQPERSLTWQASLLGYSSWSSIPTRLIALFVSMFFKPSSSTLHG